MRAGGLLSTKKLTKHTFEYVTYALIAKVKELDAKNDYAEARHYRQAMKNVEDVFFEHHGYAQSNLFIDDLGVKKK